MFLKVYLTLLASLAIVASASALLVHLGQDDQDVSWRGRRETFLAEILPPAHEAYDLQSTVDRLAKAVNGDISVFDASGTLLAAAGKPISNDILSRNGPHRMSEGFTMFVVDLPDGRHVAARALGGPGRRNPLAFLVVIAVAIGITAYPIVRRLTQRLEKLRKGVETWGSGKLVTRVSVDGGDEVAAVARSFNKAADHIEELLLAHRSLLANASHELRSPLARLRMAIEIYEQTPRDSAKREIVQNLVELDSLVEEILLASRLDHLAPTGGQAPVDLLALVAEEGARNGIAVAGEPAIIRGNPKLLQRLVRNLMQNAQRHGAPPVTARVERRDGRVRLSVQDRGPGLPEGESSRVFEPFYRPPGRAESAGGWGLGLSLVRQIANHHAAEAGHLTPANGGAIFFVTFPGEEEPLLDPSSQWASTASSRSATILAILIIGLTAGPAVSL